MNFLIGKFGKSVLFNTKSWGDTGGDNEAPKFYENLIHRNPTDKFYMIGRSDYELLPQTDKNRINKHSNFINLFDAFSAYRKTYTGDAASMDYRYLEEHIKKLGIKFDAGIFIAGPTGTSNVYGKTMLMRDSTVLAKPLEMLSKYVAPMVNYLNDNRDIPYALIVNDPRFFPMNARDLFHFPKIVLSQYNDEIESVSRTSYTDCITITHKSTQVYAEMETMFLIGLRDKVKRTLFSDIPIEKDVKFMIVLNEGRPSRYNLLKESILDHVQDVKIYGKWSHELTLNDKRFVGSIPFHTLQDMLPRVKYTYCIPIKKGWVTSKFCEMVHHGIIPFLHHTYDEQDSLKAPSFLRCSSAADIDKKIKFLEKNPSAYTELLSNLKSLLTDDHYSGKRLNDITMNAVKSII